jgi:hypothetical protein
VDADELAARIRVEKVRLVRDSNSKEADWGFYLNPADKPKLPWWRRVLKL